MRKKNIVQQKIIFKSHEENGFKFLNEFDSILLFPFFIN